MKRKISVFWGMLLFAALLAAPALLWRVSHERASRSSLILFDLLELHAFKSESTEKTFQNLMGSGVSAFLAPELTAEELKKGVLENVAVLPVAELAPEIAGKFSSRWGTALALSDAEIVPEQIAYLEKRFHEGERVAAGKTTYYRLPFSYAQLEKTGLLPDLESMAYLSQAGVPLVFAPAQGYAGTSSELLDTLSYLCERFATVKALCPAGEIAASQNSARELGQFARDRGLLMAQVEFSRQYGAARQVAASWPNVVSLHGVDREEVLKRSIIRQIMLNRLFRAAEEREVRLLVLRLDPLRAQAASLDDYCRDVRALRTRLDNGGFARLWPSAAPRVAKFWPIIAAFALSLLLIALAMRIWERFSDVSLLSEPKNVLIAFGAALLLGGTSLFASLPLRLSGALAAGLLATEASLVAMERWKVPLRGVVEALVLVTLGGLVIAGCFSTPLYMYRLSTFSGVKLSLLMPPALILLIDLHRREHPEGLAQILSRPPLWGELALAGVIVVGALVMVLRSGNYGFVSTAEILFRDWIEKILGARPRTKEFLIGYPALVCWYYLKRADLWGRWREVLRLAVSLAFSSAVNSFCHFHTPLSLTLLRGVNGWWTGLVFGCAILAGSLLIGRPVYNRVKGLFS